MTLQLADKREISREQWLELRRAGIGGSDAAAVLGLNPYASPLSVYMDKVQGARGEQTLAMEVGSCLEPFLRKKFEERMKEEKGCEIHVQEVPCMLGNSHYPFMIANLDGQFTHPELGKCGLELKTTGGFNRSKWEKDHIPRHCYIQVQHYMAVTGLQHFYLGILIGNGIFSIKQVPRDQEIIQTIIKKQEHFWNNHVLARVPPDPSGLECDSGILKEMFPEAQETTVELPHCQEIYHRYKDLKKKEKHLKQEMEHIRQQFMAEMKEAQVARVGGKKITWKVVEKKGYTVPPSAKRVLRIH